MRQVNPPRSAIFDGFYGFKRSRTFWISKDHILCVYKASGRHTCYPGSVPAGTGISPVPTGTLPGGPRGPLEAIQTCRLCHVDDMGAWVCPDSTKWSRIALCGALTHLRKKRVSASAPQSAILDHFVESGQTQAPRSSTRHYLRVCIASGGPRGPPGKVTVGTG